LLSSSLISYACQPCDQILSFDETVKASELTIIGHALDSSKLMENQTIRVEIMAILKGNTSRNIIRVRSWYGMCAYGLFVDSKVYIFFLQKVPKVILFDEFPTVQEEIYEPVQTGCAVKYLPLAGIKSGEKISSKLIENLKFYFNK